MKFLPTPTTNAELPFRNADFATLVDGLDYAARGETGLNYYSLKGELSARLPYSALKEAAEDLAHRLIAAFPKDARIGLIAQTCPDFHILFFACQYAGLAPVPLPLPVNLGGRDSYVAQIRQMMANAGASAVAAPADLVDYAAEAAEGLDGPVVVGAFEDFRAMPKSDGPLRPFGPDDLCYIQYSSGSTSAPKGVLGTQRSVMANVHAILNYGLRARRGDRAMSWLPLYHDMGLVGFALAPMMSQITIDYLATSDFVRRPLLWPKLVSANRSSLSFSPSFGYDLCARRAGKGAAEDYDLACWRVAGIGGDMVRPDALERFAETFAPAGFALSSFIPSYGLAESTLAVSFAKLEEPFRVDEIDMQHYTRSSVAQPASAITKDPHSRRFVVCGAAMPGHDMQVRGETGEALPDRHVGRVMIKGPSVTPGYFQNQHATDAMFAEDGWMDTGDMGYMLDGEVVITGRSKDLILYNGRNIWPQDIEWAVEKLPGVKDGSVAAFSVPGADGGEDVVTVVECRVKDPRERQSFVRDIAAAVHAAAGVPSHVVLAPPRSMVLTSSGKLSRAKVKAKYEAGAFDQDPIAEQRAQAAEA